MKRILMTTLLCWVAMTPYAVAECEFAFQEVRQDNRRPYSSFQSGTNVLELAIAYRTFECDTLAFTFESAHDQVLSGHRGKILYRLKDRFGDTIRTNGINREAEARLAGGRSEPALLLNAFLDPGSFVAPGDYRDTITVTAFSNGVAVDQIDAELSLLVSPEADISLNGASDNGFSSPGGGSLNFGRLKSGKERFAFLFVRSNVNYGLSVASENRGHLVHLIEQGREAQIDYTAWLDQSPLDLAVKSTVATGRMTPQAKFRPHKLTARIGDVTGKVAGDYQDVLLVEVVFLE